MGELLRAFVNKILKVLSGICIVLLSVSIVMLVVSLDPGVKWNEYTQDVYRFKAYYFSTLFSSIDVAIYAGEKNSRPCDSLYMLILNPHHDDRESWKVLIRTQLQQAVGLVSGALFIQTVLVLTRSVTKQKLFAVITKLIALGTGMAGGYLSLNATGEYVKGIPSGISVAASSDYFVEKEDMQIGYKLAKYAAVFTMIGCGLIVADIALYIPFGEGKWISQKKTNVIQDTGKPLQDRCRKYTDKNMPKQPVTNKRNIVSVKEFRSK